MLLSLIIWFLSALIPGWLILALWFDQETKGWFKKTALAYGLGTALVTVEIFLIVFIFRRPLIWLYPVLAVEILALGWQYWRRYGFDFCRRLKIEAKNPSLVEIFLALLTAWPIAVAGFLAWLNPVMNWDSIAMWSFKAKALFYNLQGFFDPASQWFWQNQNQSGYPWLIPLAQYWLAVLYKGFDEAAVNFIFVGFFVAVIFLLYGYLRNYLNRLLSLSLVFLLATMPLVSYHAYNAYADLPLAFYLGAAFILTYKWLDTKNHKYLRLSWLFLAAALLTKNEAIIFLIAQALLCLWVWRGWPGGWRRLADLWPAALLLAPWIGFKIFYKLTFSNVGGGIAWHPQVISQLFQDLFMAASWNIWWYIFFGLSLLFIKQIIKERSLALAYGWWCLSLGGLLLIYLLTEEYQFAVDGTAFSRNLINFVPGSLWLLGLVLRREFFDRLFFRR